MNPFTHVIIGGFAILAISAYATLAQTQQGGAAALTVKTAQPEYAEWPQTIPASGWLQPWNEAVIASETSGLRIDEDGIHNRRGLVGGLHSIREFGVADHCRDAMRAQRSGKGTLTEVGVEQDDVGPEQRRPEHRRDEASPVAATNPHRTARSHAAFAECLGECFGP